jgi:very-short-patch-repair endonuclease
MDEIEITDLAEGDAPQAAQAGNVIFAADLASTFTFASHQNSIPVIRSIRIENSTADSIENARLELTASPAFLRAKTWVIERIMAGEGLTLSDRRIELDAAYLAGLDEAERGDIKLRLLKGDRVLAETIVPVRLLARDEWGGVSDMAQLLPAFIMPNDPAIFRVLRSAAERLAGHGHSSALDGYQSNDPKRAYMLAAAVYSAIAGLGLHYAQPPASFESRGQKVRGPSKIAHDSIATCLDTTLLFAAALEAAGLNTVALLLDGHAFAAVWLVKRTLPKTVENDVAEIRKAIAARELVVFETTGVTHRPAMTFEQAKRVGETKLEENAPQRFISAVDIARSRSAGIMPLASHEATPSTDIPDSEEPSEIPLPAEPDFLMPADIAYQKPTTAAGRIERWQTRLLDLSLRNRLLNFSDSKRAVSFLCPDVAFLEDRLADDAAIKIISLPEQNPLGERDADLHRDRRGQDLHRGFAAEALLRDELSSMLDSKDLFARLTELYRQVKSDITEGGTNTLYLAIGMLKWKKAPADERIYRAPILLLPVKLERSGVSDRFRLKFHEDEPRLNATLLQFVKREFDVNLPDFRDGLPQDGIATLGHQDHAPALIWSQQDAHDAAGYGELELLASRLGMTYAAVKIRPVLRLVHVEEWTSAWQEMLITAARTLGRAAAAVKTKLAALSARLGLAGIEDTSTAGLGYFADLARDVIATSGSDHTIILHKDFAALTRAVGDLEKAIATYRDGESGLSARYAPDVIARIPVEDLDRDWREADAAIWPKSWLAARRIRRLLGSYANVKTANPATDLALLRKLQATHRAIEHNAVAGVPLAFAGLDTDCQALTQHLQTAERLRTSLVQLGEFAGDVQSVAASIAAGLKGQVNRPQIAAATEYLARYKVLQNAIGEFETLAGHSLADRDDDDFLSRLDRQMDELEQSRNLFRDWSSWCAVRARAIAKGLAPLVTDLENGAVVPDDAVRAFRLGYARWWLPLAIDASRELRNFRRFEHEHAIADFREVDDLVRAHATDKVISSLVHGLPSSEVVPRQSELGVLRHQMGLQRPSRSIRDMIGAMPESFGKLAPCVLMSPLSIAQYLPTHQALFDVVIFDEASQIATWDAVGAIARGHQTIIVGDPKQLPPTNFFGRNDGDDDSVPEFDRDLESILDEAKASGLPTRHLRWHYRSRHESLIAFSNWHYYDNNLITFPSPVTQDEAVSVTFVPTGVYDRGKSRTNREEARAIAADIRVKLEDWLGLPEQQRPTIGVITFNVQQQALIQDFLDDARRGNPALEWFFADERIEPVIVKNLENIQGDERDVIYFSITFCRDAAGKLPMTFGAINRDGGERRLNVAVTRARRELKVFSGIRADDIDLDRSKATGVRHLKAFLDYAVRGAIALPAQHTGSQGEMESPFEQAVAAQLERRGWQIVPQVGVSGFRIDLGIRHPDHGGLYLAGIECDGATYHSSATARDRDKVREQVLRGLGWTILRVWSTDWWFNAEEAIERLDSALNDALTLSRAGPVLKAPEPNSPLTVTEGDTSADSTPKPMAPIDAIAPSTDAEEGAPDEENERAGIAPPVQSDLGQRRVASSCELTNQPAHVFFATTDLSAIKADPDCFFEFTYRPTLQAMVDAVMDAEAPVRDDVLAQRVARVHGWLRTGARIREQITLHLRTLDQTEETSGTFLWKPGSVAMRVPFRRPQGPDHRRGLAEISIAELADFVISHPDVLDEEDPPLVYARLMQVERLAAPSRERLLEAIARARTLSF